MSDVSDIINTYMIRQPVEAVQLKNALDLARVGRWMNECGAIVSWVSAEGKAALAAAAANANKLWLYGEGVQRSQTASLGDWVVRISGSDFLLVNDQQFNEVYQAVSVGEAGSELSP